MRATRESGWLAPGEISTDATRLLRNLGLPLARPRRPTVYDGLDGSIGGYLDTTLSIGVELGEQTPFPAKVVDAGSALLDPATLDRDGLSPTDAAVRLAARLVTTRRELGADLRRSVVLLPPDGAVPDPDVAARLATFVDELPGFAMAPLSALPGSTDTMVVGGTPQVVTLPDVGRSGPQRPGRPHRPHEGRRRERRVDAARRRAVGDVERRARHGLLSTGLTTPRPTPSWPGSTPRPTPCSPRSRCPSRSRSR